MKRIIVGGAVAIALAAAACSGEPTGSSTHVMSPAERQALAATLLNSPQMGAYGPIAGQALVYVNEVGQLPIKTIRTDTTNALYNAVGLWIDINALHGPDTVVTQFFTLLAWQGTTGITKLTLVLGAGNTAPTTAALSSSFNGISGGTAMAGSAPYAFNDVYVSTSGSFSASSVSFPPGTNFTQGTMTGSYSAGTLGGNFAFQGVNGSQSTLQQTADFTAGLPAVRLIVRGSF